MNQLGIMLIMILPLPRPFSDCLRRVLKEVVTCCHAVPKEHGGPMLNVMLKATFYILHTTQPPAHAHDLNTNSAS